LANSSVLDQFRAFLAEHDKHPGGLFAPLDVPKFKRKPHFRNAMLKPALPHHLRGV